ncbi:GA-like domain-containing protein [Staphylococcus ureilyticus]|uniref:GA-like domain-containing protein n=1 Tax=Staphylococcus ureilyticus TaxID=94138 RepID=UPI0034DD9E23
MDTKLAEVTSDDLVTPDEKLDALVQTLETAKETAKEKVNSVPNGTADLQTRLDNRSPEVNDADGNGVLDTDQLFEASQAVVNGEQAKTAVDTKLSEITRLTPDEKSEVDALIQH